MSDMREDQASNECSNMQRDFLIAFRRHLEDSARIDNIDNRVTELKKEHDEFREKFSNFMEKLQPVHDAYLKGMTLKSKAGTAAIAYVAAMALFPQLSPSAIVSLIKVVI